MVFDLNAMKRTISRQILRTHQKLLVCKAEINEAEMRRQEAEKDLLMAKQKQNEAQRSLDLLKDNTLNSLDRTLSFIKQTELEWSPEHTPEATQKKV